MTELTDTLRLHVLPDPVGLGQAAGRHAATILRLALAERRTARLMLAAAPSQTETLHALAEQPDLDFARIDCFHMDDYLGLPTNAPQLFGGWLRREFVDRVGVGTFHQIDPANDPAEEARRYAVLLGDQPFDLLLCGLGVNGHLAFNDPPADFADPEAVRVVRLDEVSRRQQVDEGHFADIDAVPTQAITVTIPRLLAAGTVICSVPTAAKRQAVTDTLLRAVDGGYPGTALRTHPDAHLYVDAEAAPR